MGSVHSETRGGARCLQGVLVLCQPDTECRWDRPAANNGILNLRSSFRIRWSTSYYFMMNFASASWDGLLTIIVVQKPRTWRYRPLYQQRITAGGWPLPFREQWGRFQSTKRVKWQTYLLFKYPTNGFSASTHATRMQARAILKTGQVLVGTGHARKKRSVLFKKITAYASAMFYTG